MATVVPNETVPATVYRILLPHERQVITVRLHPAIVTGPLLLAVGGLIAAGAASLAGVSSDAAAIIWFCWLLVLLNALWRVWRWLEDYFVVTPERLLRITGVLARDVSMIPLARVDDLRFRRSPMGRVLGYGNFIIQETGRGGGIRTVNFLPYPEQLYIEVCGLIYPDRNRTD